MRAFESNPGKEGFQMVKADKLLIMASLDGMLRADAREGDEATRNISRALAKAVLVQLKKDLGK